MSLFDYIQYSVQMRGKKKTSLHQSFPILCTFPSSHAKGTSGFSRKRQSGEGVIPCRWSLLLPVNSVSHHSAMLSISFAQDPTKCAALEKEGSGCSALKSLHRWPITCRASFTQGNAIAWDLQSRTEKVRGGETQLGKYADFSPQSAECICQSSLIYCLFNQEAERHGYLV